MKDTDIAIQFEWLVNEMDKLRALIKEPKDARWFPRDGDSYWFVNTALVPNLAKYELRNDDKRVAVGNAFETQAKAEELALRFRNCAQAYNMEIESRNKGE